MSGLRSNGTDLGGPGYIHPKSKKYNENYDRIFGPREPKCDDCEDCDCNSEEGGGQSR